MVFCIREVQENRNVESVKPSSKSWIKNLGTVGSGCLQILAIVSSSSVKPAVTLLQLLKSNICTACACLKVHRGTIWGLGSALWTAEMEGNRSVGALGGSWGRGVDSLKCEHSVTLKNCWVWMESTWGVRHYPYRKETLTLCRKEKI